MFKAAGIYKLLAQSDISTGFFYKLKKIEIMIDETKIIVSEEKLRKKSSDLYDAAFKEGIKASQTVVNCMAVICAFLFSIIIFMCYHYGREHKRVQELEAGVVSQDSTTKYKLQEFRDKLNDTLDNYYMINKNDLGLISKMQIDTSQISSIQVKITTEINPK